MNNIFYFILGGFVLLGVLGIFAIPAISDIPPTPAFKIINTTLSNVTARTYSDFISFEGIGITITPNYDLQKITFEASNGGINNTLSSIGLGQSIVSGQVLNDHQFKGIDCIGDLTCSSNSTDVRISYSAPASSGEANTQSSPTHANSLVLTKSGVDLPIKGIACGTGTSCASNSTDVTISASGLSDGDKGDITVSGSGATWTIDNDVVTYAKMQNIVNNNRFLGRISGANGDAEELTGTQATTLLDTFTSALKGLVPLSGGGTTNFLRADGTWAAPPSGGGPTVLSSDVTCTSTASYCTVFTIPLTASSGNYLNIKLIGDSNTANGAIQMRVQFDNAGNNGYCLYRTFTTATAEVLDTLAATTATDTGETVWLAGANIPMPLTIDCGFETDGTPGNAVVEIQAEVASTITIQKGSHYIKTP